MSLCEHLNSRPTYKIEGGICINCNKFKCYRCTDFSYRYHIYGKYGKQKIKNIRNNKFYKYDDDMKSYRDNDMLAICFDCVECINHPTIGEKIKYWCCGL